MSVETYPLLTTSPAELGLEAAECPLGYPVDQARRIAGSRWDEFRGWFRGQTGAICMGCRYDHDLRQYVDDACTGQAHGPVVYAHDFRRWVNGRNVYDW